MMQQNVFKKVYALICLLVSLCVFLCSCTCKSAEFDSGKDSDNISFSQSPTGTPNVSGSDSLLAESEPPVESEGIGDSLSETGSSDSSQNGTSSPGNNKNDNNDSGHGNTVSSNSGNSGGTTGSNNIDNADTSGMDFDFSDSDLNSSSSSSGETVDLGNASAEVLNITEAGIYTFTGALTDKMITVDVGTEDKVYIILDNVTIKNSKGPAIYIKEADKVFITAKDGTVNTISDGSSYTYTDGTTTVDGAVFSMADLTLNGAGKVTINGNNKHGVVSKDNLIVTSGTFNITSANVGLNGKDCVKINGGNITVKAGTDGIRSDNAEDTTRGFVYIEGGTHNISAGNDGIQAETVLKLNNANITVKAGSGSSSSLSSSSESYKGFKAVSDILISGGTYSVDSTDDSIHSNNTVSIEGGTMTLSSGDDGIHADTDLSISGGTVNITKSYEGLEGTRVLISGGNIKLTASDDGINAAGGVDSSSNGRPGGGSFSSSNGEIVISGGYTVVNANGDGVDSNGNITVSGGVTLVNGPTGGGNGAMDFDGSAVVSGGVFIAVGTSDMAQGFSSATNQGAALIGVSSQSAGKSLALCDSSGKVIVAFTPQKSYQMVCITAPGLSSGGTYTLVSGGSIAGADANGYAVNTTISGGTTIATFTMSSNIYSSSSSGGSGWRPGGR